MNRTQRKKGAALEMALVFMLVVFGLCAMIVTMIFAMRANDRLLTRRANRAYVADQLGEYFVRALQQNNTVEFTKDAFDEDGNPIEGNYCGGWILYVNRDEETGEEEGRYALNLSVASDLDEAEWKGNSTLRIAEWEDLDFETETLKEGAEPLLIVSLTKTDSAITVNNWSDQSVTLNEPEKQDRTEAQELSAWERFLEFLKKLLRIIGELITGLINIIRDLF